MASLESEYLSLAISSTAKLKGFVRTSSRSQGITPSTRLQRDTGAPKQQKSFLKTLADRLHTVQDWLESLDDSHKTPKSTLIKLLDNLERLCVPRSSKGSSQDYAGLKNLSKVEDTRLIKIAQATGAVAEKRRQDLLRILVNIALAPSIGLRETFEASEASEKPAEFWFPKRLDSLHTVLYLHRVSRSTEQQDGGKLVARMCLANSKMISSKMLRVGMLMASESDSGLASAFRWKEAQIEVYAKEAQVKISSARTQKQRLPDAAQNNTDQLTVSEFYHIIQENEPSCLCLRVHDQNLTLERRMPKDISNYIVDRPSIGLTQILRPDSMNARKRLYVSYLLIRAFWQCYGTKWMDEAWTKVRIHFMYTINSSQQFEPQLYAHQPFLTTEFAQEKEETPSMNPLRQPKVRALGIMLLELELGTIIESHRPYNFLDAQGRPNANTDLSTAQLLVPQDPERDKVFKTRQTFHVLREIIRKCLYAPDFNACRNDNHERSIVYQELLMPIESALKIIGGDCEEIRFQPVKLQPSEAPRSGAETIAQSPTAINTRMRITANDETTQSQAKLFDCIHDCTKKEGDAADEWLSDVERIREDCFDAKRIRRRVKIAILDTGIDHGHTFFEDEERQPRIVARESFLDLQNLENLKDSPRNTKDSHGHGTHIAGILLQVAPEADLYIGRVVRGDVTKVDDALQIAKGIRWAISQKVDIITMSLGFNHPQWQIREAITEAYGKNILVFASASNSGANPIDPIAFPARMPTVICISATDSLGNKLTTTPPFQSMKENFSVIGAGINSAWLQETMERKSGTSFATPIAAGLAALVLEYANQRNEETPGAFQERHLKTLHTRDGMAPILTKMGSPEASGFRFLRPWVLWGDRSRRKSHSRVVGDIIGLVENV